MQNWLTPIWKPHSTPPPRNSSMYQNRKYLSSSCPWLIFRFHISSVLAYDTIEFKVSSESTLFGFWALKIESCPPSQLFSWIFGQKLRIAHPVNYSYLPPWSSFVSQKSLRKLYFLSCKKKPIWNQYGAKTSVTDRELYIRIIFPWYN